MGAIEMFSFWLGASNALNFLAGFLKSLPQTLTQNSQRLYCITLVSFKALFAKLRKATISFVMSVCSSVHLSEWNNSALTGQTFIKFDIQWFFENLSGKFQVSLQFDKNNQYIFLIISRSFLLRMRTVSEKRGRENKNTHFMQNNFFFLKSRCLWNNVQKYSRTERGHRWQYGALAFHARYLRLQTYTLGMCNTHCFSTATMVAKRTSMWRYTYIPKSCRCRR